MSENALDFIRAAAHVVPTARQLHTFRDVGFYAFVHFSPNTFTDLEWGLGNEDEAIFNPTELDCRQWCAAIRDAGMKGIVITAKHHDGFCLWQTKTTTHSMVKSPYKNGKGDVVRELSEAAAEYGLQFGFYLSPWDRNCPIYGTDEYNDFYRAQLTELLTQYGKVFHVWFDGACGEGPNGRKQVYDFDSYIALIRKYQPDATIFNDHGPDIRWCGNESGDARYAEWAVVPSELCFRCENVQTGRGPLCTDGTSLSYMYNGDHDIGALSNILYSKGLVFAPSEIDMSIRKGWFYHADQEPHSLERLWKTYLGSVGSNTTFILNIPPMPSGLFDPRDVARLHELGEKIRAELTDDFAAEAKIERLESDDTQPIWSITVPEGRKVRYLVLREDIAKGQRVETFVVYRQNWNSRGVVYRGTTIGNRKIIPVDLTGEFRVQITSARDVPEMLPFELY